MRLIILILTIFLSSCSDRFIKPQLALPEPLVLPKTTSIKCPKEITKFVACLDKKNYSAIVRRDSMQKARRKTLREIIKATRK